jgi:hypothetical protein
MSRSNLPSPYQGYAVAAASPLKTFGPAPSAPFSDSVAGTEEASVSLNPYSFRARIFPSLCSRKRISSDRVTSATLRTNVKMKLDLNLRASKVLYTATVNQMD